MKPKTLLLCLLLLAPVARAETYTFTWDVFPDPAYTGYILDWNRGPVPSTNFSRMTYTNWAQSWGITNRLTNSLKVTIPDGQLVGATNFFYVTATGPATGTNLVSPSYLSLPVTVYKNTNRVTGNVFGAVEIQSATNLAAVPINWRTEEVVPVNVPEDADAKFFRSLVLIRQGAPILPVAPQPPSP